MKNFIIVQIAIISIFNVYGQSVCSYVSTDESFNIYKVLNSVSNSDDDVRLIIKRITDKIGAYPNFITQRLEGAGNCYAYTDQQTNIRYILYDRDFLTYHAKRSNSGYWAIVFILAHEIGHHINGHNRIIINSADQRNNELQADFFAGFIFSKLGGSKEDLTAILDLTGFDLFSFTPTHPAKIDRLSAAMEGYNKAIIEFSREKTNDNNIVVLQSNQIAQSIESNSKINNNLSVVDQFSIKGKEFKQINKFSNPQNWFISSYSPVYLSDSKCYIYKHWTEDFTYQQAPPHIRNHQMAGALITNSRGKVFCSFDPTGQNAFIFNVYSTHRGVLKRNKNLFKTKIKLKNTSNNIFPDDVWTNKERTKLLFMTNSQDPNYPYKTIYIDVQGYQKVYNCMSSEEQKKFINPDEILKLLNTAI